MALSRNFLKGLALTDEQLNAILEEHTATVDRIKGELKQAQADAEAAAGIQKELDALKKAAASGENWQAKYDAEHKAFEDYKAETTAKQSRAARTTAFEQALKAAGVSDKYIATVVKASGAEIDALELDDAGNIKDGTAVADAIKNSWGDFIPTVTSREGTVAKPMSNVGAMTKEQIMQISDRTERRAAIAANPSLFK